MQVYGTQSFDPQDHSLSDDRRRAQKKRIYTCSRLLSKSIVFLRSSYRKSADSVAVPNSSALRILSSSGNVRALSCNKAWTSVEAKTKVQNVAPAGFGNFDFLIPHTDYSKTKRLMIGADQSMSQLLLLFPRGKNIYVLEVIWLNLYCYVAFAIHCCTWASEHVYVFHRRTYFFVDIQFSSLVHFLCIDFLYDIAEINLFLQVM